MGGLESLKRKVGGNIRADKDGNLYKFDIAHKERKVHLEKIVKKSDGFHNTAEVDPETGNIMRYIKHRDLGK